MKNIVIYKNSVGEAYVNQRGKMVQVFEPQRKYWTVSRIAAELNESVATIRNWSDWFNINPKRNERGERRFNYQEYCRLKVIFILLRVENYTVRGAQREMGLI